ncbi:hypothetical protein [Amycolatopsis sp. NBC_01480]|uniref:hypothetical protein n=1 Tax=Amycolatopsis sp. NBC_01480 TaxID=2903562 RepID=UPI002E2D7D72|nr:hypothetical protein [Amycolatopsis sp. NBC_01480]
MPSETDIDPSTLTSWVELFDEFLDAVARRIDGGWTPALWSQAETEIRETAKLPRADGSGDRWGRDPANRVYAVAEVLCHAIIDHVRSLRTLMTAAGPPAPTAVDALARGALEAASTIWWLTDQSIAGRARVARLYAICRASAMEYERAFEAMQGSPIGHYGKSIADLDAHYCGTLGFQTKLTNKGAFIDSEGQKLPGYTNRVKAYLKAMGHPSTTAVYNFLSGSAHAQLWRLEYGYTDLIGPDGTVRSYQYYSQSILRVGMGVAAESLAHAVRLCFEILGRNVDLSDVWRYAMPINRVFSAQ